MDYLYWSLSTLKKSGAYLIPKNTVHIERIIEKVDKPLRSPGIYRLVGLSGALAVIAGAYGSHGFDQKLQKEQRIFQTGAHYHLLHTLALMGSPLARYPYFTAFMFTTGTALFSGTCYAIALKQNDKFSHLAPVGGVLLIVAWLSFCI
ncbi:hypothetical protein Ciccas_002281 [Cichlidogyrus casuarinus]|uniref:Transmembrane protein 256 n=1 Tax=Cichlidogyrus casuarinus TaxID=1844966 RepID=A0ABD2QHN8_9PLAT